MNSYPVAKNISEVRDLLLKTRDLSSADFTLDVTLATAKITEAVAAGLPIIIHGDYDVDGLSATAILWETIYRGLGYEKCRPFIPNRFAHGYGLSVESVDACVDVGVQFIEPATDKRGLLIAVDCGITALKAVAHARAVGFDVLIIDHHQPLDDKPEAEILWTDKLCAAGISYFLSQALVPGFSGLDLAALATIADLQALTGLNRQLVKQGLPLLSNSERFGIRALKEVAGLMAKPVGVYEAGWFLSPRLNASGRLEDALDSLRLLCSLNEGQAKDLARKLSQINTERQQKTVEMVDHAEDVLLAAGPQKIIVAAHESYHEGVIGLVAGKLAQKYHRPTVVISCGPEFCKGSARSIAGFNIVEALRAQSAFLENVGGHPMAAGFTVKTERLGEFITALQNYGESNLDEEKLKPVVRVDVEISLELVTWDLFNMLQEFEPFGIGNPEPSFRSTSLEIVSLKTIGSEGKHLSLLLRRGEVSSPVNGSGNPTPTIRAVGFGLGPWSQKLKIGDTVDVVYSIVKNEWSGQTSIEIRIKEMSHSN